MPRYQICNKQRGDQVSPELQNDLVGIWGKERRAILGPWRMADTKMEVKYQPVAGKTEDDDQDLASETQTMSDVNHGKVEIQFVGAGVDMSEAEVASKSNRKFLYIAASAGLSSSFPRS